MTISSNNLRDIKWSSRSREKKADERGAVIAIPRRSNRSADSQLAYFSTEREGYLESRNPGIGRQTDL